jgi:hypothetical protein
MGFLSSAKKLPMFIPFKFIIYPVIQCYIVSLLKASLKAHKEITN